MSPQREFSMLLLVFAVLTVDAPVVRTGQGETRGERSPRFDFPPDPAFLVLEYIEPLGVAVQLPVSAMPNANSVPGTGPLVELVDWLRIFGDGRVVGRHSTKDLPGMATEEGWLTYDEIQELLSSLQRLGVMEYDEETVKQLEAAALGPDRGLAPSTEPAYLRIWLSEYHALDQASPTKDFEKIIRANGLKYRAELNPGILELQGLSAAIESLRERFLGDEPALLTQGDKR